MEDERTFTRLTRDQAESLFGSEEELNAAVSEAAHSTLMMSGTVHPRVRLGVFREEYGGAILYARLTEDGWKFEVHCRGSRDAQRILADVARGKTRLLAQGVGAPFA